MPPPRKKSSAPAAISSAADANASGGRSVIQGLDLFIVSSLSRDRLARAQELLVLEQLAEAETRPNFRTLHESPVEIVVATNHGRGYLRLPIVIPESADAEDLVDDEPRRNVAAGGDEDAAASIEHGAAGAEKCLQVDDRQQLAADVGDA